MMVVVPTLADLLYARRDCRGGLAGLRCRFEDDDYWRIAWTRWDADGELEVKLDGGPGRPVGPIPAAELEPAEKWPQRCCRSSPRKLREILERRAAEGGGR